MRLPESVSGQGRNRTGDTWIFSAKKMGDRARGRLADACFLAHFHKQGCPVIAAKSRCA
jgi:hypothetical protein